MSEHLPFLLAEQFSISTSEARRALSQGAVRIDGEVTHDLDATLSTGARVRLGRRREFVYEPVRKEPGYSEVRLGGAEETVTAWSPEELAAKLRVRELRCGPLSRIVEGERQYYAYVVASRTSLLRRLSRRRKTP